MNLLLLSTLISILEYTLPIVMNYFIARLYKETKEGAELRKSLATLKQEMSTISMVDEFAKYAKLQRKYNKLETTLKNIEKIRLSNRGKAILLTTFSFHLIIGIVTIMLLYIYKSESVIKLPKDTLWPINYLLCWPTDHKDSISLVMWLFITKVVMSKCTTLK